MQGMITTNNLLQTKGGKVNGYITQARQVLLYNFHPLGHVNAASNQ